MFTKKSKRVYLDWASAAPVHPRALSAFKSAVEACGNPSSPHEEGRKARSILTDARSSIARLAGVKTSNVIFISGATEANNLGIIGRVEKLRTEGRDYSDMHILYLPTMHSSVLKTIKAVEAKGVRIQELSITNGAIDIDSASKLITQKTILICADAVCGETGIRYDTLKLRRIIDASKFKDAALLVDASQLPLVEKIEQTRLGAHMVTLDAQKVGGVRGIGALLLSKHDLISPITFGGGQEEGLRPGTEPVALAAAFAEALNICSTENGSFAMGAKASRTLLIKTIQSSIPEAIVIEGKQNAPHILTISIPPFDTDYAVALLDNEGYAVSTRSACEIDSEEGSHVVQILTGSNEQAKSTLRISWGPTTKSKELEEFAIKLVEVVTFLRTNALV